MPNILFMISILCWTFKKSKLLVVCKVGFILRSVRIEWIMALFFSAVIGPPPEVVVYARKPISGSLKSSSATSSSFVHVRLNSDSPLIRRSWPFGDSAFLILQRIYIAVWGSFPMDKQFVMVKYVLAIITNLRPQQPNIMCSRE